MTGSAKGQEINVAATGTELGGLMMDFPLTVQHIMWRMRHVHGASKVVRLIDPSTSAVSESSFTQVVDRAGQLAGALTRLGIRPGDRVGSLAWNDTEHLETYFGVMGMGAVLHTLNLRLHAEQLAYTVNHARDKVIIVDANLARQVAEILPLLTTVEAVIVIEREAEPSGLVEGALDYERLLAEEPAGFAWPSLDERAAASLCFTSGTTGDPKGVLYSHRSIVVHALAMSGADAYGIRSTDRALALVPLFHAMAWGLPFVCGLVGADLVLPGRHMRPEPVAGLVRDHGVTWSAGVPTLWLDILGHADRQEAAGDPVDFSSLHTVLCGGTAVPRSLMQTYESRFGVTVMQGWGMTETLPGASVARDDLAQPTDDVWRRRDSAGRVSPTYEIRVVDSEGQILPNDGQAPGEIQIKGSSVASAYFEAPAASETSFDDGWLRTGDIGTIDPQGWISITDRAKDAIKSGGEWISSVDLENALMEHPLVREAAVVGRPDDRWSERPVAFVVLRESVSSQDLLAFLGDKVAKWWLPDEIFAVGEIPRTGTGKFDKKVLRERVAAD